MASAGARTALVAHQFGTHLLRAMMWTRRSPVALRHSPVGSLTIAAPHARKYSCRVSPLTQAKENRMEAKVGSAAPDFTLASHTDQKLGLASFRGRRTVVSFLPFAFTGG